MFELIMFSFGMIWVISYIIDARKLRNGFYFMVSYMALAILLARCADGLDAGYLYSGIVLLLIIPFIIAPLFFLLLLISLFTTSVKLLKNEGIRFHNILGLLFGFLIIAWLFIFPTFSSSTYDIWQQVLFLMLTVYATSFFFLFSVFVIAAVTYAWKPKRKKTNDYIIVLGAGLIDGQKVTPLLASRIDKAITRYRLQIKKGGRPPILIMSGGKGSDERVSEAEAMHRYALEQGIPKKDMRREEQSTNTYENMWYSKKIIDKELGWQARGLFTTNNFHVFRSSLFARKVGLRADGVGSKTKFYYFLNAVIREFIGILSLYKHVLLVLFALTMVGAILGYMLLSII